MCKPCAIPYVCVLNTKKYWLKIRYDLFFVVVCEAWPGMARPILCLYGLYVWQYIPFDFLFFSLYGCYVWCMGIMMLCMLQKNVSIQTAWLFSCFVQIFNTSNMMMKSMRGTRRETGANAHGIWKPIIFFLSICCCWRIFVFFTKRFFYYVLRCFFVLTELERP